MTLFDLILIAISLSMDAFAVSICKGLAMPRMRWRNAVLAGLWFGFFQGLMPTVGFYVGTAFASLVAAVGTVPMTGATSESIMADDFLDTDTRVVLAARWGDRGKPDIRYKYDKGDKS